MSISFNHPSNVVTSTDTLSFTVQGGTPQAPKTIRFNSNSIIVPVRPLPTGEIGSLVLDNSSRSLKYHNGTVWVELLSKDEIISDIANQIVNINNKLNTKVDTVTYTTSSVPTASISGTTLNIVFPNSSGGSGSGSNGMFTTSPPGSIMHYALNSGQSIASIREQLGGFAGSQNGRNGSAGAPFLSKDGWTLADGNYWTWNGLNGTVTKIVPNLNQAAYLKSISGSGITKTDAPIGSSGSVGVTNLTAPDHYHGIGAFESSWGDEALFINGKTFPGSYNAAKISGDGNNFNQGTINGSNNVTALTTTSPVYTGANSLSHGHPLNDVDVVHFNVAVLYNIAEPGVALPESIAEARYVKISGGNMQGPLTVQNPVAANSAVPRSYVDNALAGAAKSYAFAVGAVAIPLNTVYTFGTVTVPTSNANRLIRVSLPVLSLDEDGQGSKPGFECYIRVNGVNLLSNLVWIPHDSYGNGLSYTWTPVITTTLPANVSQIQVGLQVNIIEAMKNLRCETGAVWVDVV